MGGVGVINYLQGNTDAALKKVILLAPAVNTPLKNSPVQKLFIAAEDDMIMSNVEVYRVYEASSDPKTWKEFSTGAHAQRLFETEYREELIKLIIDFIKD